MVFKARIGGVGVGMNVEKSQGHEDAGLPYGIFHRKPPILKASSSSVGGSLENDVVLKELPREQDPFGDLNEWGNVLSILDERVHKGNLQECQPGLIRILRFKGNWRLREETLRRLGTIQHPSGELVIQVIDILTDDNVYFDARILAADALRQIVQNARRDLQGETTASLRNVTERLRRAMQPFAFDNALKRLHEDLCLLST